VVDMEKLTRKELWEQKVIPKARTTVNKSLNNVANAIVRRIKYVDAVRKKLGYVPLHELDSDIDVNRVHEVFQPWILAGGSLLSLMFDEPVHDYDLFFPFEHLPILLKYLFAATYAFDFGLLETKYAKHVNLDSVYKTFSENILEQVNSACAPPGPQPIRSVVNLPKNLLIIHTMLFDVLKEYSVGCSTENGYSSAKYDIYVRNLHEYSKTILTIKKSNSAEYTSKPCNPRYSDEFSKLLRDDLENNAYTSSMYLYDIGFTSLTENSVTLLDKDGDTLIQLIHGFSASEEGEEIKTIEWTRRKYHLDSIAEAIIYTFDLSHVKSLWITKSSSKVWPKELDNKTMEYSDITPFANSVLSYRRAHKFMRRKWILDEQSSQQLLNGIIFEAVEACANTIHKLGIYPSYTDIRAQLQDLDESS